MPETKTEILIKMFLRNQSLTQTKLCGLISTSTRKIIKQQLIHLYKKPIFPPNPDLIKIGECLHIPKKELYYAAYKDYTERRSSDKLPPEFTNGFLEKSKVLTIKNNDERELIQLLRDNPELIKEVLAIAKTLKKSRNR